MKLGSIMEYLLTLHSVQTYREIEPIFIVQTLDIRFCHFESNIFIEIQQKNKNQTIYREQIIQIQIEIIEKQIEKPQ